MNDDVFPVVGWREATTACVRSIKGTKQSKDTQNNSCTGHFQSWALLHVGHFLELILLAFSSNTWSLCLHWFGCLLFLPDRLLLLCL